MLLGMEHVGIAARDTGKLKDWYINHFDLEIAYDNGKLPATYFLRLKDNTMIEIYPAADESAPAKNNEIQGIRHLALTVSDFDKECRILLDEGVEVVKPPLTTDKGVSTFFFRDPEGNILHFISRSAPL